MSSYAWCLDDREPRRHRPPHRGRHAYATLILEAGVDLAVVSKSLGHSNISTTADVYAHLTPQMRRESATVMDGILGKRANG